MSDRLIQIQSEEQGLLNKISELIKQSRTQVINQANSTLTFLFWQIGRNIKEFVLLNKRADYGKQIVSTLSTQLVAQLQNLGYALVQLKISLFVGIFHNKLKLVYTFFMIYKKPYLLVFNLSRKNHHHAPQNLITLSSAT